MYTPHPIGLQVSLDLVPGYGSSVASGSVSGLRRSQTRQVPRAPLHGSRCYLSRQGVLHPVSRRDSAFIAPTGSCANPKPSPHLGITLAHGVFTGCYQPLLGVGPSRHYLCESFPTCLDPYPGGPQGAFTRFFPQGVGLPRSCSGSALHNVLDSHFSPGGLFGAAAISSCSGPPVCLPPRWLPPRALPGVGQPWLLLLGTPQFVISPWSRYASCPNRAIDSGKTCTSQDSQPCRLHRKT